MSISPVPWRWDEFQPGGTDYTHVEEVARYDRRMGEFRDIAAETAHVLKTLDLAPQTRLLEIGCGTGAFAIAAAQAGHQVSACDVSQAMIDYAQQQAQKAQAPPITFQHAGFLTLPQPESPFDVIVSQFVLHHLPDFWKAVALRRVHALLVPGGLFYLADVVFDFPIDDHATQLPAWVAGFPEGMQENAAHHASEEFSAFAWQLEAIFRHGGLGIERCVVEGASVRRYHLRRLESIV